MRICPVASARLSALSLATMIAVAMLARPVLAEPITLSIIDTGGDLASTQAIIENYKKANPQKIKEIKLQRAPAPEVPAKIKAQQDAGRLDINLILTGQDGGSVLAANNQLIKLFPAYDKMFPRDELTDAAKALQDEGEGYLLPSVTSPGGPVLIYNPSKVPNPPKTAAELMAWAKANPGRFIARRDLARRRACRPSAARKARFWDGVPELRVISAYDRARQRCVWPHPESPFQGRDRTAGPGDASPGAAVGVRSPIPGAALGRPAATRGNRQGAGVAAPADVVR
jgi:hypothetical protein